MRIGQQRMGPLFLQSLYYLGKKHYSNRLEFLHGAASMALGFKVSV